MRVDVDAVATSGEYGCSAGGDTQPLFTGDAQKDDSGSDGTAARMGVRSGVWLGDALMAHIQKTNR